MSFLDNLENTLKTFEGAADQDAGMEQQRRQDEKSRALAAAPYADQLKRGEFTNELLTHAVRIGHGSRTKVNMTWIGSTLRLDARERRLELAPTADGVLAVFSESGEEQSSEIVDLQGDPEALARRFLDS